jgi:hypothetical protein
VPDCNANGVPDSCDISNGTSQNDNGDAIPDDCQPDCNTNGDPDDYDIKVGASPDCNGNAIPDECDIASGTPDCNGNSVPDSCDIAAGSSTDFNANGIPDDCEPDCNANGVPDSYEIKTGAEQDCNLNKVPDSCDVLRGAPDVDANGVPDSCQTDCDSNAIPDESARSRAARSTSIKMECPTSVSASQISTQTALLELLISRLCLVSGDQSASSHRLISTAMIKSMPQTSPSSSVVGDPVCERSEDSQMTSR